MNTFLKTNQTLVTYFLILILIVPIFGINFFISFISNVMLLLFLIPLLVFLIILITFNSLKSKINTCTNCGAISFGMSNECTNCGANLEDINIKESYTNIDPKERTIEIKAEQIE